MNLTGMQNLTAEDWSGVRGRIAAIGILPTLTAADLTAEAMTDVARYRALDRSLRKLRREPFRILVRGEEELSARSESVALEGASTLAIITEWQEFRSPDFERVREMLADPVVFDGRNLYEPEMLNMLGLEYYAMGRGRSVSASAPKYGRRKTDNVQKKAS